MSQIMKTLFRGIFDYVYGGYIIRCAVGIYDCC